MSQLSKQDLDVAVKVLIDKVEFIMKAFAVSQANPLDPYDRPVTKNLLQVYYETKAGATLDYAVNGPQEAPNVSVDETSSERENEKD